MSVDIDDNEEEIESEDVETPSGMVFTPAFTRDSKKGDKVYKNDTPIDNAADVPLFNDADKRGMRHVMSLRVIKLNNPRSGYKGDIPPSSTLQTIANLYGDGLYTVEALNAKHQVIRTKENVRISMEDVSEAKIATSGKAGGNDTDLVETIKELNRQHETTISRLLESANSGAKESKENAKEFVKLVQTQAESTITRDREYVGAMNKGQQEFFATMMSAQSQQFQQMFMLMTMGHQHLIQALKVTYEGGNANKGSDVDTLLKGIMVAQQLGGNDDPDWLKALTTGGSALKDLLKLKDATENPAPKEKSDEEKSAKEKPKIPISKNELLEILRLKKELNRRGIDFGEMVRQARENLVDEEIEQSESSESKPETSPEQTE